MLSLFVHKGLAKPHSHTHVILTRVTQTSGFLCHVCAEAVRMAQSHCIVLCHVVPVHSPTNTDEPGALHLCVNTFTLGFAGSILLGPAAAMCMRRI